MTHPDPRAREAPCTPWRPGGGDLALYPDPGRLRVVLSVNQARVALGGEKMSCHGQCHMTQRSSAFSPRPRCPGGPSW